jgi:uncharacterized protein
MATLLHLLAEDDWRELRHHADVYAPPTLAEEGFVHCSASDDVMLAVANLLYANLPGRFVVLSLDEARLRAEVRWEAPSPPPPGGTDALFPHVYGPLDLVAVTGVRRAERSRDGRFVGFSAYPANA